MKSIAIFGGTFNPVHLGHEHLLKAVLGEDLVDKVIVMPSKIPPHKEANDLASELDRFNMCKIAFSNYRQVSVSDYEFSRSNKSFSVYTIKYLKEKYPEDKLYFIMGSDMLLSFHRWYKYQEILKMCGIICLSRCDDDGNKLENYADSLRDKNEVHIVNVEPFEVSSTLIREKLKKYEDCSCYLNKNVVQYIEENNLY